jgi:hypothetical protein
VTEDTVRTREPRIGSPNLNDLEHHFSTALTVPLIIDQEQDRLLQETTIIMHRRSVFDPDARP